MNNKKWLYVALIIIFLGLIIRIILTLVIEPWFGKKLETKFKEKNLKYAVSIGKVHISMFSSGIELDTISISSARNQNQQININGTIASVKIKGLNLVKAIFSKKIVIRNVTISNSRIKGIVPERKDSVPDLVLPLDVRIGRLIIDNADFYISNSSSSLFYEMNEGVINVYGIHFSKQDTLSIKKIKGRKCFYPS